MFPQADPRAITWDLQRNGGSVQATTERLLVGGRLEVVSWALLVFTLGDLGQWGVEGIRRSKGDQNANLRFL